MPFEQVHPRPFKAMSVREHAPALSGVYGLSNAREWVYIGETDNIQDTLLGHLRQSDAAIENQKPTGFVYEICDRAQRTKRQDSLIVEYRPACNQSGARKR